MGGRAHTHNNNVPNPLFSDPLGSIKMLPRTAPDRSTPEFCLIQEKREGNKENEAAHNCHSMRTPGFGLTWET